LGDSDIAVRADALDSYINHNRNSQNLQSPQDATNRLQELRVLIDTTEKVVKQHGARIKEVRRLYQTCGNLPALPSEAAMIWTPLLGPNAPNENQLRVNLSSVEQSFCTKLAVGFDNLQLLDKERHFTELWRLRAIKPNPTNGVGQIYPTTYDGAKDKFGVEWHLTGLDGWVLHGHGQLVWDGDEQNVTGFALPSLHIKPSNAVMAQGVGVELSDNGIKKDLERSSLRHMQKLAKNRNYADIFAHTKYKKK
jgi:hypothetical protein